MVDKTTKAAAEVMEEHRGEAAYNRCLPAIMAVKGEDEIHINVDMPRAAILVLGSLPEIRAVRSRLEAKCRDFDFERFDQLEDITLAATHAHMRHQGASRPKGDLQVIKAQVEVLRNRLYTAALPLADFGLLDPEPLAKCKQDNSLAVLASDVQVIVSMMKDNWSNIQNRTPLTIADLNAASELSIEMMAAVGVRDQGPEVQAEAKIIRRKAYTLFRQTYDTTRTAILYACGEEEGNEIAPSLFEGRGGRKPLVTPDESGEVPAVSGQTQTPARAAASGDPTSDFVVDNAAGLPITSPFKK